MGEDRGWVLVTGATSGIGEACALHLAASGVGVIACGRNREKLRELEQRAAHNGHRLTTLPLDVTNSEEILRSAAKAESITSGKGICALVNNAGYGQTGFLLELSHAEIRRQFEVNLFSIIELTRALLPQLERNRGIVVNMGSIISRLPVPWAGLYSTVKTALRALTDVLRVELAGAGIRVVLIEPGAIRTRFFETAIAGSARPHPPNRAFGKPSDVAISGETRQDGPSITLAEMYSRASSMLAQANYRPFLLFPQAGPQRVAELVAKIIRRRIVRRRYVVPRGTGALLTLIRLLPNPLLDRARRRAFFLP